MVNDEVLKLQQQIKELKELLAVADRIISLARPKFGVPSPLIRLYDDWKSALQDN